MASASRKSSFSAFPQTATFLIIMLAFMLAVPVESTPIEDKLETQIDLRSPRSFSANSSKILSVRQIPVFKVSFNVSGVVSTRDPPNDWHIKYWYETREPNMLCPGTPIGIATHTDWTLLVPCLFTGPDPYALPRTIFVHTPFLPHFVESTLPGIHKDARFILLSAGADMTVPRSFFSYNYKLRGFSGDINSAWGKILNDPRVIHWYCENHDMNHPKLSTLPTAFVANERKHVDDFNDHPNRSEIVPITQRPLKFIVSDKVRSGTGIWADRQYAIDKCKGRTDVCYFPTENYSRDTGLTHKDFVHTMSKFPFIACVHGSGIEPSPKAWEAVLIGCIPIIQHSTLDDAYEKLPVVFIHEWKDLFENPDIEGLLRKWLAKLAPYYEEGSALRKRTLEYWLDQIQHKYNHYMDAEVAQLQHSLRNITPSGGKTNGDAVEHTTRLIM